MFGERADEMEKRCVERIFEHARQEARREVERESEMANWDDKDQN